MLPHPFPDTKLLNQSSPPTGISMTSTFLAGNQNLLLFPSLYPR